MFVSRSHFCRLAALAVLMLAPRLVIAVLSPPFTYTGFGPGQWGASDATLGITGYVLENFESTTLAAGLSVGWATTAGNTTPAATLPFTFNPVTQASFGTAFQGGLWDDSNAVVNTRTNQSYLYTDTANWGGDIVINFSTPVTSVGFSLQQNDFDVGLFINGSSVGGLQSLTGLAPNGSRYGYIRIDGNGGNTITSLQLVNGRVPTFGFNDGFVIDHLAFAAIPEPATMAWWLAGAAGPFALWRRRRGA